MKDMVVSNAVPHQDLTIVIEEIAEIRKKKESAFTELVPTPEVAEMN